MPGTEMTNGTGWKRPPRDRPRPEPESAAVVTVNVTAGKVGHNSRESTMRKAFVVI